MFAKGDRALKSHFSFALLLGIAMSAGSALADEPHVMWRSGASGLLAVDPLAAPAQPSNPATPTNPSGPSTPTPVDDVGIEANMDPATLKKGAKIAPATVWYNAYKGAAPYTFSAGGLPAGLILKQNSNHDSFAWIEGTPTATNGAGTDVTISVVDGSCLKGSRKIRVVVTD
jgi:hypothetical protein